MYIILEHLQVSKLSKHHPCIIHIGFKLHMMIASNCSSTPPFFSTAITLMRWYPIHMSTYQTLGMYHIWMAFILLELGK